jgi:hypothetical protein
MNMHEVKKFIAEAAEAIHLVDPATKEELDHTQMSVLEANVRRIKHASLIMAETHQWLEELCRRLGIEPEDGQIVGRRDAVTRWAAKRQADLVVSEVSSPFEKFDELIERATERLHRLMALPEPVEVSSAVEAALLTLGRLLEKRARMDDGRLSVSSTAEVLKQLEDFRRRRRST